MNTKTKILFLMILFFGLFGLAKGTLANTIPAASCNQPDVQLAISAASDGDTVVIPNGTCPWTAGISTPKQIKIQGQTKGSVILTLNAEVTMFELTTGSSFKTEVSNLNFLSNLTTHLTENARYIRINGNSTDKPYLIHDNDIQTDYKLFVPIDIFRMGGGVIYNNAFWGNDNSNCGAGVPCGGHIGITLKAVVDQAAASWATPSTMGMDDTTGLNNVYVEDNTFTNVEVSMDWDDGSRAVVRHNTFNDSTVASHGADTSYYGMRHVEVYDNTFVHHNSGTWTIHGVTGNYPLNISNGWWGCRSGTSVVTGNIIPEMGNGYWGTGKPEIGFQIQQIDRNAGPDACCALSNYEYPCFHQIGTGMNNTPELSYVWGNNYVDSGQGNGILNIGIGASGYGQCSDKPHYNDPGYYIQLNRDYALSAKPGWVRYTYPHPLRNESGSDTTAPNAPQGLTVQ